MYIYIELSQMEMQSRIKKILINSGSVSSLTSSDLLSRERDLVTCFYLIRKYHWNFRSVRFLFDNLNFEMTYQAWTAFLCLVCCGAKSKTQERSSFNFKKIFKYLNISDTFKHVPVNTETYICLTREIQICVILRKVDWAASRLLITSGGCHCIRCILPSGGMYWVVHREQEISRRHEKCPEGEARGASRPLGGRGKSWVQRRYINQYISTRSSVLSFYQH